MACNSKGLSLFEEKKLPETIRNFPVLYQRSKTGFKERSAVKNAWTEMARSLDFIENWDLSEIYSKISKCVSFFSTFGCTKLKGCPNLSGVIRKYRKKYSKLFHLFPFHNTLNPS